MQRSPPTVAARICRHSCRGIMRRRADRVPRANRDPPTTWGCRADLTQDGVRSACDPRSGDGRPLPQESRPPRRPSRRREVSVPLPHRIERLGGGSTTRTLVTDVTQRAERRTARDGHGEDDRAAPLGRARPGRRRGPTTRWRSRRRPRWLPRPMRSSRGGAVPVLRGPTLELGALVASRRRPCRCRAARRTAGHPRSRHGRLLHRSHPWRARAGRGHRASCTTMTSSGAPRARATSKATGTPPRGSPSTTSAVSRGRAGSHHGLGQVTTSILPIAEPHDHLLGVTCMSALPGSVSPADPVQRDAHQVRGWNRSRSSRRREGWSGRGRARTSEQPSAGHAGCRSSAIRSATTSSGTRSLVPRVGGHRARDPQGAPPGDDR